MSTSSALKLGHSGLLQNEVFNSLTEKEQAEIINQALSIYKKEVSDILYGTLSNGVFTVGNNTAEQNASLVYKVGDVSTLSSSVCPSFSDFIDEMKRHSSFADVPAVEMDGTIATTIVSAVFTQIANNVLTKDFDNGKLSIYSE